MYIILIFIFQSERRHYDSFPVFKLSSDAILIDTAAWEIQVKNVHNARMQYVLLFPEIS